MTSALVCGLGNVGRRVARTLVDGDGIDTVVISDRRANHRDRAMETLGSTASIANWPVTEATMREADVVVTALADSHDLIVVELAIRCGTNVVSVSDHPDVMLGLQNFDARAIDRGVTVVGGCGLSPGCTEILARHGASLFDSVDEIKIARAGAAGRASLAAVHEQRRAVPVVWRKGWWRETARLVEQVWFPEPIGATECQVVRGANDLLASYLGASVDLTTLWADVKRPALMHRHDEGLGGIRVEVWGVRDGHRDVVVYGIVDRVSSMVAALAGWTAEQLAAAPGGRGYGIPPAGVHSVAEVVDVRDALRALGDRGVTAAIFEGAPIS